MNFDSKNNLDLMDSDIDIKQNTMTSIISTVTSQGRRTTKHQESVRKKHSLEKMRVKETAKKLTEARKQSEKP